MATTETLFSLLLLLLAARVSSKKSRTRHIDWSLIKVRRLFASMNSVVLRTAPSLHEKSTCLFFSTRSTGWREGASVIINFPSPSRALKTKPEVISATHRRSFSPLKQTKLIIHGFTDKATNPWVIGMAHELLAKVSVHTVIWFDTYSHNVAGGSECRDCWLVRWKSNALWTSGGEYASGGCSDSSIAWRDVCARIEPGTRPSHRTQLRSTHLGLRWSQYIQNGAYFWPRYCFWPCSVDANTEARLIRSSRSWILLVFISRPSRSNRCCFCRRHSHGRCFQRRFRFRHLESVRSCRFLSEWWFTTARWYLPSIFSNIRWLSSALCRMLKQYSERNTTKLSKYAFYLEHCQ